MAVIAQRDWRFCRKCQGLFFNGGGATGVCPAGGAHENPSSDDYALFAQQGGPFSGTVIAQRDWRFCSKCQGLFFNGLGRGACPSGGAHDPSTSGDYALLADADRNLDG